MGSQDLRDSQRQLLARILQRGGVLVAPFHRVGEPNLLVGLLLKLLRRESPLAAPAGQASQALEAAFQAEQLADIEALEASGRIRVERDAEGEPHRLELTVQGYIDLGVE